ncbi:MAG: DUF4393 domain-containing protein [Oscillospiraceae bacterium]|nr:DUF4393 domain-containing protein [Oscillospiraceae bacterium]
MSLIIPEDLPDCIDKPVEEALTPVSKGIGKTLSDLWFIAMGGISQCAEKKRAKYAIDLDKFKKTLEEKVEAIPSERRIEPNTQIACQALEDAKYCAENKDIREMFANLIASTIDSKMCQKAHPSFSAILKQMTTKDAILFKSFIGNTKLPVCNFVLNFTNHTHRELLNYVYLKQKETEQDEIDSNSLALSALERLGLIHLYFDSCLVGESLYQVYADSNIFQSCKETYESDTVKVVIQKGYAELTVLGRNLLEICCPPTKIICAKVTVF